MALSFIVQPEVWQSCGRIRLDQQQSSLVKIRVEEMNRKTKQRMGKR